MYKSHLKFIIVLSKKIKTCKSVTVLVYVSIIDSHTSTNISKTWSLYVTLKV